MKKNNRNSKISLAAGSGGKEMNSLIKEIQKSLENNSTCWKNKDKDSATFSLGNQHLVFTTDSFTVQPLFFPGGNIGDLAFCGTVNDLSVMGADPIGISLSLVIEEGFSKEKLFKITKTVGKLSKKHKIPIVTGDTKVMNKGSIDKLVINTSGVGLAKNVLNKTLSVGDRVIISGSLGDHGAALLAKRFDFETNLKTDSEALYSLMKEVRADIKQAKDITRGGLASITNELVEQNNLGMLIDEEKIPIKKSAKTITNLLGIDVLSLACEGRIILICPKQAANKVLLKMKKFNKKAAIIGEIIKGSNVIVQTVFGKKILFTPTGNIVPRIC